MWRASFLGFPFSSIHFSLYIQVNWTIFGVLQLHSPSVFLTHCRFLFVCPSMVNRSKEKSANLAIE